MIKEKRICERCGQEKFFYNHTAVCQACRWYERKHGIKKTGPLVIRDGFKSEHLKEYRIWRGMVRRCKDKNDSRYGGRGIKVCDRWSGPDGFHHFYNDMGPRPEGDMPCGLPRYTLDRIDVDKGYSPDNCRWADIWTQSSNTTKERQYSKKVGVTFNKSLGIWVATLQKNNKRYIRYAKTEPEAVRLRLELENKLLD